jgi:hypothetical protein
MAVTSADYTTVVTDCRNALAVGKSLDGAQLRRVIDVVQHAANTLDSNAEAATVNTDADALETQLAAAFVSLDAWTGASAAADIVADIATQKAALADLRTALIASANAVLAAGGTTVTDITASTELDGRSA